MWGRYRLYPCFTHQSSSTQWDHTTYPRAQASEQEPATRRQNPYDRLPCHAASSFCVSKALFFAFYDRFLVRQTYGRFSGPKSASWLSDFLEVYTDVLPTRRQPRHGRCAHVQMGAAWEVARGGRERCAEGLPEKGAQRHGTVGHGWSFPWFTALHVKPYTEERVWG